MRGCGSRGGVRAFKPTRLIRSIRLHHQQVYDYRIHRGKLAAILGASSHQPFQPIESFLTEMAEACPHRYFQTDARASQGKARFDLDRVEIESKRNHACRIADLVLQSVTHNKRRHDELQRFMLTIDSVAVEIPVYLSPAELTYFRDKFGLDLPIESSVTLTGHIDVLQIRDGAIHILDYKPGATYEKPITQLMIYALALS